MLRGFGRSHCPVLLFLILGACIQSPVLAADLSVVLEFREPYVFRDADDDRIEFPGCRNYGDPGQPVVPWRGVQLLLPPGEEIVDVSVVPGEVNTLEGRFALAPGQPQYPLSFNDPLSRTAANRAIYERDEPYPSKIVGPFTTQFLRGHGVGSFAVCPIRYIPSEGTVLFYSRIEVRVTTAPSRRAEISVERLLRDDPATRQGLQRSVENPWATANYGSSGRVPESIPGDIVDPDDDFDYVIITDATFSSLFQELADFKTARGIRSAVVLLSDIYSTYTEADDQAKIRAFITDAYQGWGIEYVLLGGDEEIIPHRGFYATGYALEDEDIAADLYYGALDGTWNDDGDSLWGEPGEDDLIPEVHVGRAAVDSTSEVTNFINKTIMYQTEPVLSDCARAIMMGEMLWTNPTWGGDYKDEIKDGASINGYTTVGFAGSAFEVSTLYDRDHGTWSKWAAIDSLNSGINICNHLGHCDVDYALKMYNGDVDNYFTNDGVNHGFFIIYSQGCYCSSFDDRNDSGNYLYDSIAEHFTTVEHAAVAFIGNTRYGWGMVASTDGSSQYFDRQFFDALFAEDITRIGDCHDDSRVDNIPFIDYGANRWCYYTLCLLGDPELDIWTDIPSNLSVMHLSTLPYGASDLVVSVSLDGSPAAGALVCLTSESGMYQAGQTGANGELTFHFPPQTEGLMTVRVTRHNCLPYAGDVTVVQGSVPLPPLGLSATPGDAEVLLSWSPNPEPDIDHYIVYRSTLPNPTDSLYAITAPETSYLDTGVTNGTMYYYRLRAVDSEGDVSSYSGQVSVTPEKPPVIFITHTPLTDTDDSANPHPVVATITWIEALLDPDSILVVYETQSRTWQSVAMAPTDNPDEYRGDIPVQLCGTLISYYILAVDANHNRTTHPDSAPEAHHSFSVNFMLIYEDDFETDKGWTVGAPGDSATTGVWERCDPERTDAQPEDDHTLSPGVNAFITQCAAGTSQGVYDVDGGQTTLFSPMFDLSGYSGATVSYYRWYSNDTGAEPNQDYWVVEASDDGGGTWVEVESTDQSYRGWTQVQLDVGSYIGLTGQVQFRFIASDFEPGSLVEAGVDDFCIRGCPLGSDVEAPIVNVLEPNGGEELWGGSGIPFKIQWNAADNVGVTTTHIVLSVDGGATYPDTLASGDLVSPWSWQVPAMEESACRIQVVSADAARNEGEDISDSLFTIINMTAVASQGEAPTHLTLEQNRPNPFNPMTEIEFGLPERQSVDLSIYDVRGRLITTLARGLYPNGYHRIVWQGTDEAGLEVSTGVYFYRLVTGGEVLARKMLLLK